MVRLAKENWGKEYIPVNEVGKEKAQYTIMDKAKKDLALGDNTIGEIVNKGQIAKSQLDHMKRNRNFYIKKFGSKEEYERQLEGIQGIIDSLTIASNISIDSAKRKYDLDMRAYLKSIDKSEFWLRNEEGKVIKPNFFKSISKNKKLVTEELDCNMDMVATHIKKVAKSSDKGIKVTSLLEDFDNDKVNQKQVTKVLEAIEESNKKIKAIRIQINLIEDSDDLYKQIDREKALLMKKLKKMKLNENTYRYLMNQTFTNDKFSSIKSLTLDSLREYDTKKFTEAFKEGASVISTEEMAKKAEEQVVTYLGNNEPVVKQINEKHDEFFKEIKKSIEPIKIKYDNQEITFEQAKEEIAKMVADSTKTLREFTVEELSKHFSNTIEYGYYMNLFETSKSVGLGISFKAIPRRTLQAILEKPFVGDTFDGRLYKNIDGVLGDKIKDALYNGIEQGKSWWGISQEVKELTNYSKKSCDRIIRTESNYYYNQGTLKSYEEIGIERYIYLSTLDTRTSKICRSLDNKVFDLKDSKVGENYPPMHVNCRSSVVAYFDDKELQSLKRRARNSEGKNILIDNISYEEWYKEYIKK